MPVSHLLTAHTSALRVAEASGLGSDSTATSEPTKPETLATPESWSSSFLIDEQQAQKYTDTLWQKDCDLEVEVNNKLHQLYPKLSEKNYHLIVITGKNRRCLLDSNLVIAGSPTGICYVAKNHRFVMPVTVPVH